MRRLLPAFFFIIIFFSSLSLLASSSHGGNITYRNLGGSKYLITITLYRDCRGMPLNPSQYKFGYFAGTGYGNSCKQDTLGGFTRVAIKDVSLVCTSVKKPCSPANTLNSGDGTEAHIFQKEVDLGAAPFASYYGSATCGDITFYANRCCRNGAITTGPGNTDFYITATIRTGNLLRCANKLNSSGQWLNNFPARVCCAFPLYYNPGYTDSSDKDSVSYALAPALSQLPATSATYTSPFTYNYPVTVYCPGGSGSISCASNPATDPPRGMYVNSKNGDVVFTPIDCDEMGLIVFEATEWRKDTAGNWLVVGRSNSECMVLVKDDCGYNKSPIISGPAVNMVCAGDKICFNIDIEDKIYTPHQMMYDTLSVDWINPIQGATITILSDTIPNKDKLEFCWQTSKTDALDYPHQFEIIAHDNYCTRPAISAKAFSIFVQKRDSAWSSISTPAPCNAITFKGNTSISSAAAFDWLITDSASGKIIYKGTAGGETLKYLTPGTYKVSMKARSSKYCYDEVINYFNITNPLPVIQLINDTAVCSGASLKITSSAQYAAAPISYIWKNYGVVDGSSTSSSLSLSNLLDDHFILIEAKDNDGCVFYDSVKIKINALPDVAWVRSPLQSICYNFGDFKLNNLVVAPHPSLRSAQNFRIYGSNTKYGTIGLVDSLGFDNHVFRTSNINNEIDLGGGKTVTDKITVWFRDTNGCESKATADQRVNGIPVIVLQDRSFCQNTLGEISCDSFIIRPKTKFGNSRDWKVISAPSGVDKSSVIRVADLGVNHYFQGGSKSLNQFAGNYVLQLKVTDVVTGCFDSSAVNITLRPQPVMSVNKHNGVCNDGASVDLSTLFNSDGNAVILNKSKFKIVAYNSDTNSAKWKNVVLKNGYLFPASAKFGKYTIWCETSLDGCLASEQNDVITNPMPLASFITVPADTAPKTLPYFTTENKSTVPSFENMTYVWYFDYPGPTSSTALAPVISYPLEDDRYLVRMIAKTSSGCLDTFEKQLVVGAGKANSITQLSNSGQAIRFDNEFRVVGADFRNMELRIYDLSGKLLHTTTQNNGVFLPNGIYVYRLQLTLKNKQLVYDSGQILVSK